MRLANMNCADEAVDGAALVEMQNQDFKELGISSVGHRLTLLKAVYDVKIKQNIPLDPDHYVPLSMLETMPGFSLAMC